MKTHSDDLVLLSEGELVELLHVGKTTLRRWLARGWFPRPLQLGPRRRCWRKADVVAWLAARAEGVPAPGTTRP